MTAPALDRPTVDVVLPLCVAYYEEAPSYHRLRLARDDPEPLWGCWTPPELGNPMGGALHIVLDDENLRRPHIRWCLEESRRVGDIAGELLAQVLLTLSLSQMRRLHRRLHLALAGIEAVERG